MNRKLKQALTLAFQAPAPSGKTEFLSRLPYPKATGLEFFLSQIKYIRKRFWCLSVLVLVALTVCSAAFYQGQEIVGILSALLPLLTLASLSELHKSVSFQMAELESSCKYNLEKVTLIRLCVLDSFHLSILLLCLFFFKSQSQYNLLRYAVYAVTPFLLSSYLSFWMTNHLSSKHTLTLCSGITLILSGILSQTNPVVIFSEHYTVVWCIAFLLFGGLLCKELYFFLTERSKQWNFA